MGARICFAELSATAAASRVCVYSMGSLLHRCTAILGGLGSTPDRV